MTYDKQGFHVDEEHLESFAENLAHSWRICGERNGKSDAAALLRALRELNEHHSALSDHSDSSTAIPGAVRWLLDNHYLARREGLLALRTLRGMHRLRYTEDGSVLMLLCRALLQSGCGDLKTCAQNSFCAVFSTL